MLRASTYADQLAACNDAGDCWVTNDVGVPFSGAVSLRLINVQTGTSAFVRESMHVELAAGAGVVKWFCAAADEDDVPSPSLSPTLSSSYPYSEDNLQGDEDAATPPSPSPSPSPSNSSSYIYSPCRAVKSARTTGWAFKNSAVTTTLAECHAECDSSPACAGFIKHASYYAESGLCYDCRPTTSPLGCSLYTLG